MPGQTYRKRLDTRQANAQKQGMAQKTAPLLEVSMRDIQMLLECYAANEKSGQEELAKPIPDEEFLDPPEMEDNLETGEDMQTETGPETYPEDFWLYSGRMLAEEYGENINDDLLEAFNLARGEENLSQRPELEAFLKEVEKTYPMPAELSGALLVTEPDIIFSVKGKNDLQYSVNVGPLERALTWNDEFQIGALCSILGISRDILSLAISRRRENLSRLADYLIFRQNEFLLADNMIEALRVLKQAPQKDFSQFVQDKYNKKIDPSGASRTINNKWIRVPFQPEPLTADLFFNLIPRSIIIKISEAADEVLNGSFVAASVFNTIYQALTGEKITTRQMRNYIKDLGMKPGKGKKQLGSISDDDLLEIALKAAETPVENPDALTIERIQEARERVSKDGKAKNK